MLSLIEKKRQSISWFIALFLFSFILFSHSKFYETFVYESFEMLGYILIVFATLGRIWCGIYIGGRKDNELCYYGPYSIVRNPLYLFSFIGFLGIILCSQILILLSVIPFLGLYYYFVIESEEQRLHELFGKEFVSYCSDVNRIIPNFKNYKYQDRLEISPRILTKSIIHAAYFMWIFMLMEFIEELKNLYIHGKHVFPILWNIPF